jgi:xanthine dehydrogenase YagS FAD-binding subunit
VRPFSYQRVASVDAALRAAHAHDAWRGDAHVGAPAQYLAGGTNLIDLMKIGVVAPESLVDINDLQATHGAIAIDEHGLHLGALVRMAELAEHADVRRDWRVVHDALSQAASPQLRQMASLGGNVLQRTRCNYFRDISWPCNKRRPGSGCAAIDGVNRRLAVLGVSEHCIANYPGDLAIAFAALEAEVEILGEGGHARSIAFEDLHRLPADTPHRETNLEPGELITGFRIPHGPWLRRSLYLKVRDRASYDFALASAAVALDLRDGIVAAARIGLGGLVTKPWRSREAEDALRGRPLDAGTAMRAAEAAFAAAVIHDETDFKPELGRRTLVRALLEAAALEAA